MQVDTDALRALSPIQWSRLMGWASEAEQGLQDAADTIDALRAENALIRDGLITAADELLDVHERAEAAEAERDEWKRYANKQNQHWQSENAERKTIEAERDALRNVISDARQWNMDGGFPRHDELDAILSKIEADHAV